ncbi:MAG: hypothetical protein GY835_01040 [bacterium]|nr:hypothetical protein [bacterium]
MAVISALLLIGPTGAGKTPLGETLEIQGFTGIHCAHFDFGANLRRFAVEPCAHLSDADRAVIRDSLATGRLLTDDEFPIAGRILEAFHAASGIGRDGLVALNGLPRHVGQARDLEPLVKVICVISLTCTPEVVRRRIRFDSGGDREGRIDDSSALIAAKLRTFNERTQPLLAWYREQGVPIKELRISSETQPEDLLPQLRI